MPMSTMLVVELFDVWDFHFIGLFMSSYGCKYSQGVMDYMSKWVEAVALDDNGENIMLLF